MGFRPRIRPRCGDESACKPDSVPRGAVIIHLRGLLPAPFAVAGVRPTRTPRASSAQAASAGSASEDPRPFLVLLQVGFAEPPQSPGVLVVSYTAVSPLPRR